MRSHARLAARAALALVLLLPGLASAAATLPRGGTIAIEAKGAGGADAAALRTAVDTAGRMLTAMGFTMFDDPAHAASVARLTLSRSDVGSVAARDPQADRIGIGAGLVVPFSTGRSSLTRLRRTRLDLHVQPRAGGAAWDGTAVTVREASARNGGDAAVAADLLNALLRAYPVQPTDVIGVP